DLLFSCARQVYVCSWDRSDRALRARAGLISSAASQPGGVHRRRGSAAIAAALQHVQAHLAPLLPLAPALIARIIIRIVRGAARVLRVLGRHREVEHVGDRGREIAVALIWLLLLAAHAREIIPEAGLRREHAQQRPALRALWVHTSPRRKQKLCR